MDDAFRVPPRVAARRVHEEVVVLHLDRGTYFGLDPVGARAWELLGEGLRLSEVRDRMLAEYAVARDTLERDILHLVAALEAEDLLEARH